MAIERFNSLFLIRQMAVLLHRIACQYHIVEFVANTVRWRNKKLDLPVGLIQMGHLNNEPTKLKQG